LYGIQEDEPGLGGQLQVVQGPLGDLGDRQDALRRFGLGRARELERAYLRDVDPALLKHAEKCGSSWSVGELRGHESAAQREGGPDELLYGTDPFGREQLLALARFPTPEVTS
jgi:hypothetical protein